MKAIDFDELVLQKSHSKPVLVEFSSSGCGPCLWVEKQLIDITTAKNGMWNFVSLSVEDYPELEERFQIKSNPTVILFQQGEETARLVGALPGMVVEQWLSDKIKS
jgi:putative thioredoxin